MKSAFFSILILNLFCFLLTAGAESVQVSRDPAAYNGNQLVKPATILSPRNFQATSQLGYVVVVGYIDYVATSWPEDDGDYHFEMQNTKRLHDHPNPVEGLVCEIDPVLRFTASESLRAIKQDDPHTYRKVRVYGWLRFGTERNHAGVQDYDIGGGKIVSGHWEIHPVERIETIDSGPAISLAPAQYVKWPKQGKGTTAKRYKVNDESFADAINPHTKVSNYAQLIGNVKHISLSSNGSGDLDVDLEVNSDRFLAIIPEYYVESFSATTETVKFRTLASFKLSNYILKPSDSKTRRFYGLRNWTFRGGKMIPTLAPVEMIK